MTPTPDELAAFGGALCGTPTMPLTKWVVRIESPGRRTILIRLHIPGNRLYRCWRCQKLRPAKHLMVSGGGWYEPSFFCRSGKGCPR